DDFASYTLKTIEILSDDTIELTPKNCVVVCSTPVYKMYEKLGFKILPAELKDKNSMEYIAKLPFEIVETVGNSKEDWRKNDIFLKYTHPATIRMWALYNIGEKVKTLFGDKIVGDDGDLTETRDYNSYVRQMDEIAQLKFDDTKPFIKLGRIGDIGCAVGSWIKLCCEEPLFFESDFYGVEVARKLYDICNQRKDNGDFANPNVFFVKKNAVAGLAFEKNSMNTIHTSSLTHEIESYAGHESLLKFIKNRYDELSFGGVWINRDVVGPDNKEDLIFMELSKDDGLNDNFDKDFNDRNELKEYLDKMSSYTRFFRFVKDFRKETNYKIEYQLQTIDDKELINLKLKDA
ncbi:MAG: transferase, partial [Spirochaetes bacterium RIFOXYB1_FULL_32_8]